MRRIIALFIMMVIMTTALPAAASSNGINSFFETLEGISAEERESYIVLLTPMLMVDSGIDDLVKNVENYQQGKEDSLMSKYIGKLLKKTEKGVLINFLKSLKATDLTARREFLETLRYKKPTTISPRAKTSVATLLEIVYRGIPSAKALLEESAYSEEIIANLIKGTVLINSSDAIFIFDGNVFAAGKIYSELEENIKNIWADYVTGEDGFEKKSENSAGEEISLTRAIEKLADVLNSNISPEKRSLIAGGLEELGFVKIMAEKEETNGDGAGQLRPDKEIEISNEDGKTKLVSYETDMTRPVLYKKEGEALILVKKSALYEGKLIARVEAGGTYIIREMPEKFNDCDGWAKIYIEMLAAREIINGKAEKLYMPNDTITREEFVKLIVELLEISKSEGDSVFADVKKDSWYAGYVNAAYENKIINGVSETEFGTGMPIKRQDMAKIINTVLEARGIKSELAEKSVFADYDEIAQYAKAHVLSIYSLGIISGDDNRKFNPDSFATRAEAAKMIYGMLIQLILKG